MFIVELVFCECFLALFVGKVAAISSLGVHDLRNFLSGCVSPPNRLHFDDDFQMRQVHFETKWLVPLKESYFGRDYFDLLVLLFEYVVVARFNLVLAANSEL